MRGGVIYSIYKPHDNNNNNNNNNMAHGVGQCSYIKSTGLPSGLYQTIIYYPSMKHPGWTLPPVMSLVGSRMTIRSPLMQYARICVRATAGGA